VINFRYHLATLIAVFLALGLGVVAGSTFVSPVTVTALKKSLTVLDNQDKVLAAQNQALARTNRGLLQYATASRDMLVRDTLKGHAALLLSFDTTPGDETAQMAATLVGAGARLEGSIVLSSVLAVADDAGRQRVAAALGTPPSSAEAVQGVLVHQLTEALSGRTPGVLQRLLDAGLASRGGGVPNDAQQAPAALATPGTAVVILAPVPVPPPPQAGSKPAPDVGRTLILPTVRSLSATSVLLAVGEDGTDPLAVLGPIRQESGLHVVTADNVDSPAGQAAVALGLQQAAAANLWGSYGFGAGATSALPPVLPPPASPVSATATPQAKGG
jgi:hypothetical protein